MTRSSGPGSPAAPFLSTWLPFSFLALFIFTGTCAAAQSLDLCPRQGSERDAVMSINERLELTLKDGRMLRLAGFEPVRPTPRHPQFDSVARAHLAKLLTNVIDILPLAKPDRWGRIPVFAFVPGATPNAPAQPLAAWLLAQGDGRYLPEPEASACEADFRKAEALARDGAAGLWRDPYYAVIAAGDKAAFAEKAATNVIVEGNVIDVDVRPRRIYLVFGARHSGAFEVTIMQRDVGIFDQAGLNPQTLVGRRLRVRGLLDLRFGPEIEAAEPGAIEIVPTPEARSSMVQHVEAKAAESSEKPR